MREGERDEWAGEREQERRKEKETERERRRVSYHISVA
jgi:hypothetical protein